MEHPELIELTPTIKSVITTEQLSKALTMSVEAKMADLTINASQMEEDAPRFEAFGIDWSSRRDAILTAVAALRSAETLYTVSSKESAEALQIWQDHKDPLYHWRSESMARLGYLARMTNNSALLKSLEKISGGDGHLDAIQDVHETLELTDMYFDGLAQNNLTAERVTEAKETLAKVTAAYPKVLAGEKGDTSAKELRDGAYWYLCSLEKELKEAELPMVFFDNYDRRMEYGSNYLRDLGTKRAKESVNQ